MPGARTTFTGIIPAIGFSLHEEEPSQLPETRTTVVKKLKDENP